MFSRWRAAALVALLIVGLIAPASVSADNGTPPTCTNDTASVLEDDTLNGQITSCTNLDANNADYEVTNDVISGSLSLNSTDGSFTYSPFADFNGTDSFVFTVSDGGGTSDPTTITITVTSVNDPPSFTEGPDKTVAENAPAQSFSGWATDILEGPTNESSQSVSFNVTNDDNALFSSQPAISPAGTLTFTPAASANGTAMVSVYLKDDGGTENGGVDTSSTQTFQIDISGVNDPPSFTKGADQTVLEDAGPQTVNPWATAISPGPPDESGQAVAFAIDSNTNSALFSSQPQVDSSGTLRYTPAANANGSAAITLHAHDDGGGPTDDSPSQSFAISVTPVNDPPTFTKGPNESVSENDPAQSIPGWATNILEGPSNEISQTVVFHVSNDNTALFSIDPAISPIGTLTFTPAASANGSATVSVYLQDTGGTANGGDDTSSTVTFTITLMGVNDPPSFTKGGNPIVLEDAGSQSISGWATNVSAGPPDESGQSVTFVVDSDIPDLFSAGPAVTSNGTLTFTPAPNANGTSTITLHAVDNGGTDNGGDDTSATQSFTITITPVNDAPSFTKGPNQTVAEDAVGVQTGSPSPWATAISEGPLDEAPQVVDFIRSSDTNSALFSVEPALSPTGVLTYTLAPNANGSATIGFEAHDNGGTLNGGIDTSAAQTFKITVTPVNDLPTCASDSNATFVGAALNASIGSCADVDGDTLTFAGGTVAPAHGTVVINANGTYTYTPTGTFQGSDSFTFKANDGTGDSNEATMSILVSPDPIARNDVAPTDFPPIIQGSGPTAIPVLANDLDRQGGPLTIASVTQGAKGKVTIIGGGTGLTYDPTGLATGSDSFRYTIIDDQMRENSAIVVVIISPDATKPSVTVPTEGVVGPSPLGSTTAKIRVYWAATDLGTGVKTIQLQESYNSGPFRTVSLSTPKPSSASRTVTLGKRYAYRVRAIDTVGNVGAWSTATSFRATRSQESSGAIVYAGPWGTSHTTSDSGGADKWSGTAGASATFSFLGSAASWVSPRSRGRGVAHVYVDGILVTNVDLHATTTTYRRIVFSTRWAAVGAHTIQIVVAGTLGRPRVDLDTFVVLH